MDRNPSWPAGDAIAGIALAALLVPQGVAYAELAGLSAVTGLYTTIVGLVVYAAVGPSRVMIVGPDSSLAPLIAAAVLPVAAGTDATDPAAAAGMLAIFTGLLCLGAGLGRVSTIAAVLSRPVRIGYLNGIAAVVVAGQIPKLLGFGVSGEVVPDLLDGLVDGIADGRVVGAAALLGAGCLAVIEISRLARLPAVGFAVGIAAATAISMAADLSDRGVSAIGEVPSGLPTPDWPGVTAGQARDLAIAAIGVAFVTIADTATLSRAVAPRIGERPDTDGEIVAIGAADVACGLFGGFPTSASTSRTAVALAAGARSKLAGLVGAVLVGLVVVFGADVVAEIPSTALAAVVLVAAIRLFDVATLVRLARVHPSEALLSVAATAGVALVGVLEGIVIAVGLSLVAFVQRAWRPYDAVLGRMDGRKGYHDTRRHPDARRIPGLVLYRWDAPLFFGNADHFDRRVRAVARETPDLRWFVLAAEPVTDVDSTAAEMLGSLVDELRERGVTFAVAELKGPVKDRLGAYGIMDRIGSAHDFPTLGTAVRAYLDDSGTRWSDWTDGGAP